MAPHPRCGQNLKVSKDIDQSGVFPLFSSRSTPAEGHSMLNLGIAINQGEFRTRLGRFGTCRYGTRQASRATRGQAQVLSSTGVISAARSSTSCSHGCFCRNSPSCFVVTSTVYAEGRRVSRSIDFPHAFTEYRLGRIFAITTSRAVPRSAMINSEDRRTPWLTL